MVAYFGELCFRQLKQLLQHAHGCQRYQYLKFELYRHHPNQGYQNLYNNPTDKYAYAHRLYL